MPKTLFSDQIVLITGAGGGLGRSHALLLASLGAKVLVNDPGSAVDGRGSAARPAQETVELIRAAGGEAIADFHGVESEAGAQAMVEAALKGWGGLHAVINNAGILRDVSFRKQSAEDWDLVLSVHLDGSRHVTKAAWETFCSQGYGRVVFTTSASALYGNFGQSNYAAAKLGLIGLMNALKEEGAKFGIKLNSIAPMARSRMTEGILSPEILARLDPQEVSPVVAYLASRECAVSGQCWSVGAGRVARTAIVEGAGWHAPAGGDWGPKEVAANLGEITELDAALPLNNLMEAAAKLLKT
ncbi:MAG TPA: SDR family NAD(P)-dependent oxidoreductase [bacterium]|nr:SDR family NAD(P)-dependent oxidoreductase [bacterium]